MSDPDGKKPLVLLHGALGSERQFDFIKAKLTQHYDVHVFSFDGHGGFPVKSPFSIDLFVKNTLDYLDVHHLANVSVFGYSMGGYVALKLAYDYPERLAKIMTLGTKFHWTPESAAKEVRMMNPEVIEQKIPAFASVLADRHQPADWKEIMRHTAEMMTRLGNGEAMTEEHFECIGQPSLICIGTNDHMVSVEESERTASQLSNGRLQTIEGFKHPLEAVDQNVLADICHSFFSS